MSVLKRFNGTTWETIGPGITYNNMNLIEDLIAPEYSPAATYAVGNYVVQNNKLYRCKTAITTAEAWTAGHWDEVNLSSEVDELRSAITEAVKMGLMIPENEGIKGIEELSAYYKFSDGSHVTNIASLKNCTFPCSAGDVMIVTAKTGGAARPVNFYSGDPSTSTYLGEFYPAYCPAEPDSLGLYIFDEQVIIVPQGATKMVVNQSIITGEENEIVVKKVVGINPGLISGLEQEFKEIIPVALTINTGFYQRNNGAYNGYSYYKNAVIQVTAGTKYLVTTTYAGGAHCILFYNGSPSESTFVGTYGPESSSFSTITDFPVVIPSGVTYMAVNCERIPDDMPLAVKIDTGEYSVKLKQKIYYKVENDKITLVTRYSKNYDLVTVLMKKGTNNIFDFGNFFLARNSSDYPAPASSGATLISVGTDFLGPFKVRAVNNPSSDPKVDSHQFTGGNHNYYNGQQAGSPTGRSVNIRFWVDGNYVTNGSGYCSAVRIMWTNYIQGYNTMLESGEGREILTEKHTLYFDGETWQVYNEIEPLEDIVIELYYGMQIALPSPNYYYLRFIGGPDRDQIVLGGTTGSGDIQSCTMVRGYGANGSNMAQMTIDPEFDLGKRTNNEGPDGAVMSGTKGYFVLINEDTAMSQGDVYAFKGTYQFLSMAVEQSL